MTAPNRIDARAITDYVDAHIDEFHGRRLERLRLLDLKLLLRRKNPYLFRSKGIVEPRELIAPHAGRASQFSGGGHVRELP